jgi:integrase/recombinase XerD
MEPELFLKKMEFENLLRAAKDDRDRCILLLLGGAGLRASELVNIRIEEVDLKEGYLHIPHGKGNKRRAVVLVPHVIDAIDRYLAGRSSGWLFPSKAGDHITTRQLQNILDKIAHRAGIQQTKFVDKAGRPRHRITPHLLRHSFAVWSLNAPRPVTLSDLQEQLGHSSLTTTGIYLKASPNHRRENYLKSGLLN